MENGRVVIAEILRPRGIRGELLARSQSDVPNRLSLLTNANARLADGSDIALEIAAAWEHKGEWVLKFSGVDSIDAAERFSGADLWVPLANRGALPKGEFFESDLIGCRVIDNTSGDCAGIVEGWQRCGGPPLMQVVSNGREHLIPFVSALCEVDLAARTIRMDMPEGLLEL